jgi:membrane protein DedA with SNARE-associated domain
MLNFLSSFIESILAMISSLGYLGIFIGMTIESSFVPLPSEIILIPAGALIARGEMSFLPVFLAAIFGSVLGALINYYLAFFLGRKTVDFLVTKYGKFLFLNQEKIDRTDLYFKEHGEITTFLGRLLPLIRHLISLPAGFAKMKINKFVLFTALGAGIWSLVLIFTGYFFGGKFNPLLKIVLAVIVGVFMIRLFVSYWLKNRRPTF